MTFTLIALLSLFPLRSSLDDPCPDERASQVDARIDEVNPNDTEIVTVSDGSDGVQEGSRGCRRGRWPCAGGTEPRWDV